MMDVNIVDSKNSPRNYGVDFLRIVSMLMICTLHVFNHNIVLTSMGKDSVIYGSVEIVKIICLVGVNCYALISGYVNVLKKIKFSNAIKLWLQVITLSILVEIVIEAILGSWNAKNLIKSALPLITGEYWYFNAYIGLLCFMPIVNYALQKISIKKLRFISCLLIFVFSVIPTIALNQDLFCLHYGYSTLWLLVLYIIGAYFRLDWDVISEFVGKHRGGIVLSLLLCIIGTYFGMIVLEKVGISRQLIKSYNAPNILFYAMALFCLMAVYRCNSKKIVNLIEFTDKLTFGVYIISEQNTFRNTVMCKLLPGSLCNSYWGILIGLCLSLCLFIGCCFAEYIRTMLFKLLKINVRISSIDEKIRNLL